MCFDESATQSNNMPKLTFTTPMNRRLARLRTEPRDAPGISRIWTDKYRVTDSNSQWLLLSY